MSSVIGFLVCLSLLSIDGAFPGKPEVFTPLRKALSRERKSCRCAPDQFETTLLSVEREFDFARGQMRELRSSAKIHYDYIHRRFVTEDLESGVKIITDHDQGLKYFVGMAPARGLDRGEGGRGGGGGGDVEIGPMVGDCRVSPTKDKMQRMCLPDTAVRMADYRLSIDVPVSVWTTKEDEGANHTMTTTIDKRHCIPISEETSQTTSEFFTATFSLYVNLTVGIRDKRVFIAPQSCAKKKNRQKQRLPKTFIGKGFY